MSDDAVQALIRALDYFAALDNQDGQSEDSSRPSRWMNGQMLRCVNGHVSRNHAGLFSTVVPFCSHCLDPACMTFPEDEDGALLIMGTNVTPGVCEFDVTLSGEYGFNTGRPRYTVRCKTCDVLVHESTTSPSSAKGRHMRYGV